MLHCKHELRDGTTRPNDATDGKQRLTHLAEWFALFAGNSALNGLSAIKRLAILGFSRAVMRETAWGRRMSEQLARQPGLRAQLALAGKRIHAWWEGYAFDDAAARAAAGVDPRSVDEIVAEAIWGDKRREPGAPAWTMRLARMLSLPLRANVIVFGAGAGAPLDDLRHGTRWKVRGFTRAAHVAHNALHPYDKAMQRMNKASAAGALSFFEMHRDANPSSFAGIAAELLLPGAKAVFIDYAAARRRLRLRSCFPTAKDGAPKTEDEYLNALRDAGFSIVDTQDETTAFAGLITQGWAGWRRVHEAMKNIESQRLRAEMMRALAAHAELWAERCDALKSGHLCVLFTRATRN